MHPLTIYPPHRYLHINYGMQSLETVIYDKLPTLNTKG
jgi:hypothetical protein